ncbi:PQQ-dependent sugar dehydrogenase [Clostridium sp.]|uniref:PQQ-dependent sugar dehydrogenase n=1 Tax=Clostridium sp. TaxID=1506 RepID=UPI002601F857|nr:PQQ-dependent sugar dehydrogenase [Clostridium sp.]
MRRFLKFLSVSVIIVVVAFGVFRFSNEYRMSTLKNNISWSVAYKNCKNSVAFDKDENKNTYVAYDNYIKVIRDDGREETLLQDKSLKIENIIYYKSKLYFISNSSLYEYDLGSKNLKSILDKIPSEGKYLDRNLIIKDSKLLLSIGSATNSGVATYDSKYSPDKIPYDKSSIDITLNGFNYGEKKTGAFMPYGNSSEQGQRIKAQSLANACIVEINLSNNKAALYSSGIRNIKGWDLDSEGVLYGIVGGMESTGERPINRDSDYLYKIDKGKWYGWPDFSGGDPITSPRFKGDKLVSNLISNPPNKIVQAPVYQYSDVGIIRYLAIDKEGRILDKNSKIYFDSKENVIASIGTNNVVYNLLKLKDISDIKGIKYSEGDIYILDSGVGCIYKLQSENLNLKFNLPMSIWIFIFVLLLILTCLIIYKLYSKKMKITK